MLFFKEISIFRKKNYIKIIFGEHDYLWEEGVLGQKYNIFFYKLGVEYFLNLLFFSKKAAPPSKKSKNLFLGSMIIFLGGRGGLGTGCIIDRINDFLFHKLDELFLTGQLCPAEEKSRNSRFFINRVHGSTRVFRVYYIIILCKNAAVKWTILPKVVKQNDVCHYFQKKPSKLDVSQNTWKNWRISIKVDEIWLFCLAFW